MFNSYNNANKKGALKWAFALFIKFLFNYLQFKLMQLNYVPEAKCFILILIKSFVKFIRIEIDFANVSETLALIVYNSINICRFWNEHAFK